MHISDFDYELPPHLIAREPAKPRDAARMMTLDRSAKSVIDTDFKRLPDFLRSGDAIVINDTRVIKARVFGRLERSSGTTREVELLFSNPVSENVWEVLCKPGRRIRPGDRVQLGEGVATGSFGEMRDHGLRLLEVSGAGVVELLERFGHVPLPPYIARPDTDADAVEYQTIFAAEPGAVAAPTAGLHFTPDVLQAIRERGVDVVTVTLHVGIGTFLPVRDDDPRRHQLKPEWFNISEDAARRLRAARSNGRRIVAVGTTTTRTLEFVTSKYGEIRSADGYADLYILPGHHQFRAIDALLTNFHLPKSTLLMLVSAFAGHGFIKQAYAHAIERQYTFYSYGDCMLIL